jgi:CheY-like chemotaxis protein
MGDRRPCTELWLKGVPAMTNKHSKPPKRFTTGQIATHCHVTPETVANWIKADRLKASTTPGGHYRVNIDELVRFCQAHGFEVPAEWEAYASPPTVLIIDDDPDLLKAIIPNLEAPGRRVVGADDVAHAGMLLMKYRPDVVILDLHLPGTDGIRIASILRKEVQLTGTKIVVLSGYIDEVVQEAMKDLDVAHYVNKPPDFDELSKIIDDLLSKPRKAKTPPA